jgi:hypothetical protein
LKAAAKKSVEESKLAPSAALGHMSRTIGDRELMKTKAVAQAPSRPIDAEERSNRDRLMGFDGKEATG